MLNERIDFYKLFPAIIIIAFALLMLSLAVYENRVSQAIRFFLIACGFAFLLISILIIINWWNNEVSKIQIRKHLEIIETEEVIRIRELKELSRILLSMSPEQISMINQTGFIGRALSGNVGNIISLTTSERDIPFEFIDYYFGLCSEKELYPIRNIEKKGFYQEYASSLVKFLIDNDFAISIGGNRPARWAYPEAFGDSIKYIYGERINKLK